MTARFRTQAAFAVCTLLTASVAPAQRGGGDWMTSGFDAQRSSWVRTDGKINPSSMAKPGFELVWKMKFNNTPQQLNTITPPALLDFYIGYRGFRALGFFGASANRVIGVDIDLARTEWEKTLATGAPPAGTPGCPGGLTSAVTRPTGLAYPAVPTSMGPGRATGAKSGVGEPHEGAVVLKEIQQRRPAPPKPKPAAPGAAAAPSPFSPRIQWVYALAGDGKLHYMYVSNGEMPNPAIPFLPANANAQGLIVIDGVAYAATSGSCNGVDNGVWALDLATKQVAKWKASDVAGNAGPAIRPDGTLFVSAANEVAALAPKTLQQTGSYKAGAALTSSPVVFDFKGKNLLAVAAGGQLHLVDTDGLTLLDKSAAFSAADYATGALASWQDINGVRWVLAPGAMGDAGAVTAFKVVEKDGKAAFAEGWKSRALVSPTAPVVINGVVFALSSGEHRSKDVKTTIAKSTPAVLYALDGQTGKELWNSGKTMTSFVHSGGLSAGGSRIYVATYEGTQYAFSFPIEH